MWQLYKYQPINQFSLSNLAARKLWASHPAVFNDPFEFRLQRANEGIGLVELRNSNPHLSKLNDTELIALAIDSYEEALKAMSVICFTTIPDSILMWAHYAESHRGICLGFCGEEKDKTPNDVGVYPVQYKDEYPSLDFSRIWHKDGLAQILWTKSKVWAYEKEWRRIMAQPNSLVEYPGRLNKIIFGLRTTDSDRRTLRSILANHRGLEYCQIVQDDNAYMFHVQII